MLKDLHIQSDKHQHTEILLNKYDSLCLADSNDQCIDQRKYQQIIESLMYTVIYIYLDIFFILK